LIFIAPATQADTIIGNAPLWSTPARGANVELRNPEQQTVVNSTKRYTQSQIDNKFSAPDWFPSQHIPMPSIIQYGKTPKVWACASCHLASGGGHPALHHVRDVKNGKANPYG